MFREEGVTLQHTADDQERSVTQWASVFFSRAVSLESRRQKLD